MKIFHHFIVNKYDPAEPTSPLIVSDRWGENIGSLKASWPEEEILELMHRSYEAGQKSGRNIARNKFREILGL